jgi:hypothetical protein
LYSLIVFFVVGTTTFATTHLAIAQPSRNAYSLKGPVKTVTEEYDYEMSDKKYKEIREYDVAGNLLHRKKWDYKDQLLYFSTNRYNEAGCLVSRRVENIRNKTTNDYEIVLSVSTHQLAYQRKTDGKVEIMTYDTDKWHISTAIKRKGKKILPYSKSKRDADHKLITYTKYDDNGRLEYTSAYKRDAETHLLSMATSYKKEDRRERNDYEYLAFDTYGNWTQRLKKTIRVIEGEEKQFEKFSVRKFEYFEGQDI